MLTYDAIIHALLSGKAKQYIPDGLSFSHPVLGKDAEGALTDNVFLYSVNRATGKPNKPTAYIGIHGETGALVYHRRVAPAMPFSLTGFTLIQRDPPAVQAPAPRRSLSKAKKQALRAEYKRLYPMIRSFAFATLITAKNRKLLLEYFHVQWVLFRDQMAGYRQASPEFYSWMIQTLAADISFLKLLKEHKARITDLHTYLEMAGSDEEKQMLLGVTDPEFEVLTSCGFNIFRNLLYARKEKVAFQPLVLQDNLALIAARSYDPSSATQRRLQDKKLDEVRQLARDLRKEYDLQLPIDLNALAAELGIQVNYPDLDPAIDGYVKLDADTPVITVNNKAKRGYPPRKRFTLAHEIAHVVIPWHSGTTACVTDDPSVTIDQKRLIDSQELEANVFASELLIPSDWLQEKMEKSDDLEKLLESVRKKTRASVLACLYAMEEVLPAGHVICVTSSAMKGWKIFRGPDVPAWKSEEKAFAALEKAYPAPQEFTKGTYTIRYYQKEKITVLN